MKDGFLRGVHGTEGTANSLLLQGVIQPDGSAKLDVKGLTGDPKFNPKGMQSGVAVRLSGGGPFRGLARNRPRQPGPGLRSHVRQAVDLAATCVAPSVGLPALEHMLRACLEGARHTMEDYLIS